MKFWLRSIPVIPDWELNCDFDPEHVVPREKDEKWVNYRGKDAQPSSYARA